MKVCLSWFSSSRLKVLDRGLRFSMPDVAKTGTCAPARSARRRASH